jgi:hypothetical protein
MSAEFVRVRIPETGAEWLCHPMTAEAHGLMPLDDNYEPWDLDDDIAGPNDLDDPDDDDTEPVADQQDSASAE